MIFCFPCAVLAMGPGTMSRVTVEAGNLGKETIHSCGECGIRLANIKTWSTFPSTTLPIYLSQGGGFMNEDIVPFSRKYDATSSQKADGNIENGRIYLSSPIPGPSHPYYKSESEQLTKVFFVRQSSANAAPLNWKLVHAKRTVYRFEVKMSDFYQKQNLERSTSRRRDDSIFVYKNMTGEGLGTVNEVLIGSAGTREDSWKADVTFTRERKYLVVPFPPRESSSMKRDLMAKNICYPYPQWLSPGGPLSWEEIRIPPPIPSKAPNTGTAPYIHYSCLDAYGRKVAKTSIVPDEDNKKILAVLMRSDLPEEVVDQMMVMFAVLNVQKKRDASFANFARAEDAEALGEMLASSPGSGGGG
jgi:hypothetical protein